MMRACDDVRVVDLSEGIAGGYCTKLLADLGADVVKVERPGGDPLRQWSATARPDARRGGLFDFLNTSKRGVVVDPASADGWHELLDLASVADVVVESGPVSVFAGSSRALEELRARNATATIVAVSPFGSTGPRAGAPASEFTLQAYAGSIIRGPDDEPPLHAGGRLGEWSTGTFAAIASLAGVRNARHSGRGGEFDISMLECMALLYNPYPTVLRSFLGTDDGGPRKREIPSIVPAKDGWVGFCTVTAQQWENFLLLIERPDLLEDEGLRTWFDRVARYDEVYGAIESWTGSRTADEILEQAEAFRVPAAPVGTGATVTSIDHFQARGVYVAHPGGAFPQPRSPLLLSGSPPRPFEPAPELGEHTENVRAEARAFRAPPVDVTAVNALDGVRVVDLTAFWAGPMATQCLAGLGADVIKVESVQRPDPMRFNSVSTPEDPSWYERSPIFHGANAGKRGITLDLSRPAGRDLLLDLAATADVLVENFAPRVLEQFGIDDEQLRGANPRLVVVRMPAFGLTGPWRDRVGFAQTMEQVSGMAYRTGTPDGPPLVPSGPCDVFAGSHAVVGVLAALHQRDRTGLGQLVEVPMVEVALNVAAEAVIEWAVNGTVLSRIGNRDPVAAPQGLYRAADGAWLALTVASDEQWTALASVLGLPDQPSWRDGPGRRAAHDAIDEVLARHVAAHAIDDLVAALQAKGVPAAPVVPAGRIDLDEQLRARGFFAPLNHPVAGCHDVPGLPMRPASGPPRWFTRPAPLLGEHTAEVLATQLGIDEARLAALAAEHIIGTTPLGLG